MDILHPILHKQVNKCGKYKLIYAVKQSTTHWADSHETHADSRTLCI